MHKAEHLWPQPGPFGTLYESWLRPRPEPRDPAIEAQLTSMYREAWHNDVGADREYVLFFVFDRKGKLGADLLIEGLKTDDQQLAAVAAPRALVMHERFVDLGPELRPAFRALVRRFPENDDFRARSLYGHQPGDEDDWEQRPFVNLFEDWMSDDYPRDEGLARQLAEMHREAWATGDSIDRAFVLRFLLMNKRRDAALQAAGADLVAEGLRTDDPRLARTAGFAAWCFLDDGIDLGADVRELLVAHLERFPELTGHATWALELVDKRENSPAE